MEHLFPSCCLACPRDGKTELFNSKALEKAFGSQKLHCSENFEFLVCKYLTALLIETFVFNVTVDKIFFKINCSKNLLSVVDYLPRNLEKLWNLSNSLVFTIFLIFYDLHIFYAEEPIQTM